MPAPALPRHSAVPGGVGVSTDIVVLACRQCADLATRAHVLAEQEALARRSLVFAEADLAAALDLAGRHAATIARLTAALDAVTHRYVPGVLGMCTECAGSRGAAQHQTAAIVTADVTVAAHKFAAGIGMWCCFSLGGRACGRQADHALHKVGPA